MFASNRRLALVGLYVVLSLAIITLGMAFIPADHGVRMTAAEIAATRGGNQMTGEDDVECMLLCGMPTCNVLGARCNGCTVPTVKTTVGPYLDGYKKPGPVQSCGFIGAGTCQFLPGTQVLYCSVQAPTTVACCTPVTAVPQ